MDFDHRTEGTADEVWLAAPQWAEVPALVLTDLARLVVVSAHPDDESLGASGLIIHAAQLGVPVHVVVATNGDASHPDSPSTTPAELAAVRRAELLSAVQHLAPGASVDFLELPDGRLREHVDTLAAHLGSLELGPRDLIVAPWRGDGHGDHEAAGATAGRIARNRGAQVLEYPVWMWHWATPTDARVPWSRLVTLALTEEQQERKELAIRAHTSQNAPLSDAPGDEVLLGDRFHDHFCRPFEVFVTPLGSATLSSSFFSDFYEGKSDPWGFETRWYEIRKRQLTVASLPRPLFASGLEIGCSIGVLTADLAGRCASLLATDIAEQPIATARARLIEQNHVEITRADVPTEWPDGQFDLVVVSEVAYYWSAEDLDRVLERIALALTPDGVVVACHWRHPVEGYPQRGDDVHRAFREHPALALLSEHREDDFLLDVFVRPPALSVAAETGLV
ncbi:PIG-L family deacetylase [Marisediminicola sp. LYQ85]